MRSLDPNASMSMGVHYCKLLRCVTNCRCSIFSLKLELQQTLWALHGEARRYMTQLEEGMLSVFAPCLLPLQIQIYWMPAKSARCFTQFKEIITLNSMSQIQRESSYKLLYMLSIITFSPSYEESRLSPIILFLLFLEAGADPNCRTENHDTTLHSAARQNMAAAAAMDKKADPATRNAEGRTACGVAYKHYCLEAADAILSTKYRQVGF